MGLDGVRYLLRLTCEVLHLEARNGCRRGAELCGLRGAYTIRIWNNRSRELFFFPSKYTQEKRDGAWHKKMVVQLTSNIVMHSCQKRVVGTTVQLAQSCSNPWILNWAKAQRQHKKKTKNKQKLLATHTSRGHATHTVRIHGGETRTLPRERVKAKRRLGTASQQRGKKQLSKLRSAPTPMPTPRLRWATWAACI